jgi:Asp-tRNA(Asn)/Glu-tRNA(Gln) amidotransferase A subunit family amidase
MRIAALVALAVAAAVSRGLAQPPALDPLEAGIDDVRTALVERRVTCRSLVEQYLRRIEAYDKAGPALNAVQTVNGNALQEAERLDARFTASGAVGPLHCVPVLLKDQIEMRELPTTYGSIVFKDFVPQRDATVVKKLREAGAIIVAKSTMGEFASGYVGSAFGVARNAYDPTRVPSGSSGGTAAGVAAGFATVGIGEDTGGSIRGPASVHSLVGLRPTVPLVSRFGMMPARPTTDTIGPIVRSVRDAAMVLDVLAGFDPDDPVTAAAAGHVPETYTEWLGVDSLKGARLGVVRDPLDPKADVASDDFKQVRSVIDRAIADLRRLGAEVVDRVTIRDIAARSARVYDDNVFETEAATDAYLAQHANSPARTLREILVSGKVAPARARVLMGVLGHTPRDAGYLDLLLEREALRRDVLMSMASQRLDALVYATFDQQPIKIVPDVTTRTVLDSAGPGNNRRLSPVLGFPAISVPAGFTAAGLPVGLELMGREFSEPRLIALAYAYEQGTRHRKPPSTTPALTTPVIRR